MSNYYILRNENSDLIKEIISQIAGNHDLNITIITAKPSNSSSADKDKQDK